VEQPEQGSDGRMGDYERLLGDAMAGDATLFARQDVVEAAWAIVDPILRDGGDVYQYAPGSWGPVEADHLAADLGGWHHPQKREPSTMIMTDRFEQIRISEQLHHHSLTIFGDTGAGALLEVCSGSHPPPSAVKTRITLEAFGPDPGMR
jgi:hypothetical protein